MLSLAGQACGHSSASRPYTARSLSEQTLERLVFLPARVEIEVDGKPARDAELTEALEGQLSASLAAAHPHTRYVFADDDQAAAAAYDLGRGIEGLSKCSRARPFVGSSYFDPVLSARDGDALVFVDARVHVASGDRQVAQVAAATLITVAVIAVVVAAVAISGHKGDGGPTCHWNGDVNVGVGVHYQPRRAATPRPLRPADCRAGIQTAAAHPHGFWTGSHLDLTVAVVGKDGELLWLRTGKLPIGSDGTRVRTFLAGMP